MNSPEITSSPAIPNVAQKEPRTNTAPDHVQAIPLSSRTPMLYTLAIAGFIALVGATMWLAIYSTRFVPSVVGRIGSAAVYLGSVFTPSTPPSLSVVPTASTTIPFGGDATTTASTTANKSVSTTTAPKSVAPTAGEETTNTYQIGGTGSPTLSGLPDFIVTINATGYLATSSATSFVATTTVPAGSRPAVRFTIKNIGSNVTGPWRFSASIPAQNAYIYQSAPQQSLSPGDSIDYTLGFDQANKGAGKMISITANFDHAVTESNTNNNSASASLTILGT
ncbi:MAG TPA: CARDB domain-containing protein [Candidatus Paceibacterota bacterium]|nr:CARDB domain-containing protein [Candidatus Paceibacterota bacterium]